MDYLSQSFDGKMMKMELIDLKLIHSIEVNYVYYGFRFWFIVN